MGYLEGIKFREYLISRLENNYILRVFNFAILVKIRNESLIEDQFFFISNQCNCYKYATAALILFL